MSTMIQSTIKSADRPVIFTVNPEPCRCIFYHPWQRPAIEKTGVVTKIMLYKGGLFRWVEATDGKAKWVNEEDFIEYTRKPDPRAETAELESTLEADPDYQAYLMELDGTAMDEERNLCPCCGEPLYQFEQPSLFADRPAHKLAECHTAGCSLNMVTLGIERFAKLTEADVASYSRAKGG